MCDVICSYVKCYSTDMASPDPYYRALPIATWVRVSGTTCKKKKKKRVGRVGKSKGSVVP